MVVGNRERDLGTRLVVLQRGRGEREEGWREGVRERGRRKVKRVSWEENIELARL